MATSGVTAYKLTRDDLIESALKLTGVHTIGATLSAEMSNDAIVSLNLILKSLDAIPNIKWFSAGANSSTAITGAASYAVTDTHAWYDHVEYINGTVLHQLIELGLREWRNIRNKALTGEPKYYFIEPDDNTATRQVFLHPIPAAGTINYWPRRRIEIMVAKTDEFDLPEELQGLIRFWLAYVSAVYYKLPSDRIAQIQQLFTTELNLTLPEQARLVSRSLGNVATIHEQREGSPGGAQ